MSGIPPSPRFYSQPLRYLKWASYNKPAYFYSIVVGCIGPVMVFTVPSIRRYLGEEPIPKIPLTYPVPKGERPRPRDLTARMESRTAWPACGPAVKAARGPSKSGTLTAQFLCKAHSTSVKSRSEFVGLRPAW